MTPIRAQGGVAEKPMMTKNTIIVDIRIESAKSFADVRAALERNVPQLDPDVVKALVDGETIAKRSRVRNNQFSRSAIMGRC
jgi:hypothetical protein